MPFVQELTTHKKGEISTLEIKLTPGASTTKAQKAITTIMGQEYNVKDRYQQDESLYKITNMEKWFAFIVFAFTLILVAFNMIGALWMLVLEKKNDIATLKAMGATKQLIRKIFVTEGFLLSFVGLVFGCVFAIVLCVLQQEYGLVKLTGSVDFIVDYYPVDMRLSDFIQVIITVLLIGTLAALIPANKASKIKSVIRKE